MEQLTDLKAILHSHRANIFYLEKCRVNVKDGRVVYLTDAKDEKQYWNIPIANTRVLGIPHGFAVMHGKTRRGALVFEVADLIKDAIVLPQAFICAKAEMKEQEFRQQVLQMFTKHKALDFMFDAVKKMSLEGGNYDSKYSKTTTFPSFVCCWLSC